MWCSRRATSVLCPLLVLLAGCHRPGPGSSSTASTEGGGGSGAAAGSAGSGGVAGSGASAGSGGSGASAGSGGSGASGGGGPDEIPEEICHFGAEIAFTLPSGFAIDHIDDLAKDTGGPCAEGELSYATLDMDGDLRPDLVIADRCDIGGVGETHWQVFLNMGSGFADSPISWALPSGFPFEQLDDLAKDTGGPCAEGELSHATLDMDGDSRPDLVIADRCDIGGVGETHWQVYFNEGSGFATTALDWALPSGFPFEQLDDLAKDTAGPCAEGELSYGTLDMNGDLRPDLVITDRCDIGGVGETHWQVFLNQGTGFATTALDWALPSGFPFEQLDDLAKDTGGPCAEGELSYATLDMDGDLRPDLVIADRCDIGGVGETHWQVYFNEGSGFATTALDWTLPSGFAFEQLDDLAEDTGGPCYQGELSFAVRDADGDLLADLVITDGCDLEHTGTTHWVVHRGTGSGFEDAGAWMLPGPAADLGWDALDDLQGDDGGLCVQGELSFAAIDMDGDRVLDLAVADDCDFDGVGTTHWRVFGGSCD